MKVLPGIDAFLGKAGIPWKKKSLGLVAHQASVTADLTPTADALTENGFTLSALFAPEHGFHGALQDQVEIDGARDGRLGIPVHSLYGDPTDPAAFRRLSPSPGQLKGLDALLFDLQDIGVRYYTFVWTMALAMKACARAHIPFLVLDRPNPLGGEKTEGNMPDPAFLSFVGLYPVPVRHGLTAGELALYLNRAHQLNCDLHVIPLRGWKRRMWFNDTGLPWVPPSPNMPTLDTAAVYAGTCLLEGTNLSEGRGTTRPFELIGAPFLDPHALAARLNGKDLPGAHFRPAAFRPTFGKWKNEDCGGVHIHVTDRRRFNAFLTGLGIVEAARHMAPRRFSWAPPPYEYVLDRRPFDLLCGTDRLRKNIEKDLDLKGLETDGALQRKAFLKTARPSLLYA